MWTHSVDTQSGHIRASTPDLRRTHHLEAPGRLKNRIRTSLAPLHSAPRSCAHAAVPGRIRGAVRVARDLCYTVKRAHQGRTHVGLEAMPTAWYTPATPCCTGRCTQQGGAQGRYGWMHANIGCMTRVARAVPSPPAPVRGVQHTCWATFPSAFESNLQPVR
jgi:hypothetical protein